MCCKGSLCALCFSSQTDHVRAYYSPCPSCIRSQLSDLVRNVHSTLKYVCNNSYLLHNNKVLDSEKISWSQSVVSSCAVLNSKNIIWVHFTWADWLFLHYVTDIFRVLHHWWNSTKWPNMRPTGLQHLYQIRQHSWFAMIVRIPIKQNLAFGQGVVEIPYVHIHTLCTPILYRVWKAITQWQKAYRIACTVHYCSTRSFACGQWNHLRTSFKLQTNIEYV